MVDGTITYDGITGSKEHKTYLEIQQLGDFYLNNKYIRFFVKVLSVRITSLVVEY